MTRFTRRMVLVGAVLSVRQQVPGPAEASSTARNSGDQDGDWLAGRLALSRAVQAYRGVGACPPLGALVTYRANGQPSISTAPALCCSIAHSCGWALAGVSAFPIGVDIEKIRHHHPGRLTHMAAPDEIIRVSAWAASLDELVTALWTMKEAVMKATGEGLRILPRRVRIEAFAHGIGRARVTLSGIVPGEFHVATARKGPYYMSIAHREDGDEVPRINWFKPSRLPGSGYAHTN